MGNGDDGIDLPGDQRRLQVERCQQQLGRRVSRCARRRSRRDAHRQRDWSGAGRIHGEPGTGTSGLRSSPHNTTVGGPNPNDRNVISMNFRGHGGEQQQQRHSGQLTSAPTPPACSTAATGVMTASRSRARLQTTWSVAPGPGEGNLIAFNQLDGVHITSASSQPRRTQPDSLQQRPGHRCGYQRCDGKQQRRFVGELSDDHIRNRVRRHPQCGLRSGPPLRQLRHRFLHQPVGRGSHRVRRGRSLRLCPFPSSATLAALALLHRCLPWRGGRCCHGNHHRLRRAPTPASSPHAVTAIAVTGISGRVLHRPKRRRFHRRWRLPCRTPWSASTRTPIPLSVPRRGRIRS